MIPAECQIVRPIFARVAGHCDNDWQDDRRDDSRTNLPIYVPAVIVGSYQITRACS